MSTDPRITALITEWHQAPRGGRGPVVERLARALGVNKSSAYRLLDKATLKKPRKRRADSGTTAWQLSELEKISAVLMESRRNTGKRLASIEDALDMLRANGMIRGEYIDNATGEVRLLSTSSAAQALRKARLHPDQLCAPAPKVQLSTEHPNQVWQADPSLCVLYYLKRTAGLQVMPLAEFNKNKPKNLARIENDRVWRYVFTDHASGAFYVEYVFGAESGENLCSTFIHAMQWRGAADPFCGVPSVIMVDPGSANTGAMFKNLCTALGVRIWVNQPGQPWAKGQVEKTNDIIERRFEHRLRFCKVENIEQLNAGGWHWMRHFNATAQHTRHQSSRYQAWQTIKQDQHRLPPDVDTCLTLATHAPEQRKVNSLLRISFRGKTYDVSGVPGVTVHEHLMVARHAFGSKFAAQVLLKDDDGNDTRYTMEPLEADAYGFMGAVPVGTFRAHADTAADTNRKLINRLAMDAATDDEAAAKRKAKELPFGGRIDPFKSIKQAPELAHLPRRGTAVAVQAPTVVDLTLPRIELPEIKREFAPLTHMEAARALMPLLKARGVEWTAEMMQGLQAAYPEGVPYDQIDSWADTLWQRNRLRIVREAT